MTRWAALSDINHIAAANEKGDFRSRSQSLILKLAEHEELEWGKLTFEIICQTALWIYLNKSWEWQQQQQQQAGLNCALYPEAQQQIIYLENEFWVAGGHFLDIHSSLRASNHDGAVAGPVHEDGEVGLPADVQRLGDHHLAAAQRKRRRARGVTWLRNQPEVT